MSREPKVRRGAMLLTQEDAVQAVGRDESEATVWDRQFDIRVGIRGVEMGMSPTEGRTFAALIIEAVRRAEKRQREADKQDHPPGGHSHEG